MKVGIAIKPGTKVEELLNYCHKIDMALVMTVGIHSIDSEPGFGGQKFQPECLSKVRVIRERFPDLDIQVDGGVGVNNIEEVAAAGANVIVSGTGVFGHENPKDAICIMTNTVNRAISKISNNNGKI
jgi:ribulose-phosphate 3-epimerase